MIEVTTKTAEAAVYDKAAKGNRSGPSECDKLNILLGVTVSEKRSG